MNKYANHGTALLRISLGVIYIAHSLYLKLVVFTLPGTAAFFASIGLPAIAAYATFIVEAIGGIALLLGYQVRWAALALIPVALGATWAHSGAGWVFSNAGGGWEYPLFLAITTAVIALQGNGSLAVQRKHASIH
ncbi:DoxX family protein [Porticoccus hydrocarbonoclasticus]|jgi:putative oxidoreductase|uniref:DoxX family protein n=1 Tax=Porticoccus hydrocarbonoclasticus TaxID=1073414 RepID=UPI00056800C4|nr:DoxX family protein [Porticoccus hydrocarbonoclasticus]|tara:strand:+ start:4017 stop:4421 length:405 start_codon:yes stop_codon:yes gene_type:complete